MQKKRNRDMDMEGQSEANTRFTGSLRCFVKSPELTNALHLRLTLPLQSTSPAADIWPTALLGPRTAKNSPRCWKSRGITPAEGDGALFGLIPSTPG